MPETAAQNRVSGVDAGVSLDNRVAITRTRTAVYPSTAPYHPSEKYPEYPFGNPLGHVIEPGMTVVVKPNFVLSRHSQGKDLFGIITHPSVLRAVMDYCWIALKGEG